MRAIYACLLIFAASAAQAQKVIECDEYKVEGNTKQDRSIFRLAISQDKAAVTYTLVSGRKWDLQSNSRLQVIWISKDGLRVVARWIWDDYGVNQSRWSPVDVVDLDFASPNYRHATYGGFADFDETVFSPWKHECKRLD